MLIPRIRSSIHRSPQKEVPSVIYHNHRYQKIDNRYNILNTYKLYAYSHAFIYIHRHL